MRSIWIIARHEYQVGVRRTGFIIMTVLVPIVGALGLLVAAFFGGQASSFMEEQFAPDPDQIWVVDHLGAFTPILPAYHDQYRLLAGEEEGRAAVEADGTTILLIIPQEYVESGQVTIISKEGGLKAAALVDSTSVRHFFVDHLLRDEGPSALHQRLADPIQPVFVSLESGGETGTDMSDTIFSVMVPYFLGILLIMTIFTSSGYLLRGVAEEKASRVIEIILSSVTARELLAGKIMGLGALGLTQVMVWLASAIGLSAAAANLLGMAVPLPSRPQFFVLALVYYILGFLIYAVLMGAVGALGTTAQESQQMAGIFSLAAAVPLMLSGLLLENPNMTVARVLSWFPLTAPTMMMLRLPMTEVPVIDIVGSIVVLLITIPVATWAGAKVFRMGLLMYGKRPTLAQVMAALRQA